MTQTTERTTHMRRVRLSALLIGLIAVLALVAAGCGGSDDEGGSSKDDTAPVEGKQGGDLAFLAAGDVDYMDPGQTYYSFAYQIQYAVNRPLYSFSPEDKDKARPDLADGEPQISEDNKTITVKIKPDIKYA